MLNMNMLQPAFRLLFQGYHGGGVVHVASSSHGQASIDGDGLSDSACIPSIHGLGWTLSTTLGWARWWHMHVHRSDFDGTEIDSRYG